MSNLERQGGEGHRGSTDAEVIGGTTSWENKRPQRGHGSSTGNPYQGNGGGGFGRGLAWLCSQNIIGVHCAMVTTVKLMNTSITSRKFLGACVV